MAHHTKPSFHIRRRKPVGSGFSRAIHEQLSAVCEQLNAGGESIDEAVHETRKAVKKSRALLRLLRPALDGDYRLLNVELRDAGRRFSELRDAEALAETVQRLKQQSHEPSGERLLDGMLRRLLARKKEILTEFSTRGELPNAAKHLEDIAARIAAIPLDRATPSTVAGGVAETVRRGRKAFALARQSEQADDFHEWRKRAKDLRYQISFLERLWPHVLEGYAESARDLEQSLGEDHNASVLRGMLAGGKSPREHLDPLLAILDNEQQQLRRQAEKIGHLLYSEKPKHWARRIAIGWERR